ncbi:MAG: hypothetical protein O7G83_17100 [Proteobacteria bacterium]|nr:hypothetical protein [Pseudomonadota bacterium]
MKLMGADRSDLVQYIADQLNAFFPDRFRSEVHGLIDGDLDETLDRLETCINAVRMWTPNEFDYLHSSQHCIFIYYLSNTIWRNRQHQNVCTKLFSLNKALNGFECFYHTELPDRFFIGHTVGIVLARVAFAEYLVLYQGCTVGKNHGAEPVLGEGVVLYPNSAIIGKCNIGPRTVVGQGSSIIDTDTPGQSYVFSHNGKLAFKKPKRDVIADIFRL